MTMPTLTRRHAACWLAALPAAGALSGCATQPGGKESLPLELAKNVDLRRFMGDWYVIGSIGTAYERGAYNAKETYRLDPDGTIDTLFTCNVDGYTGPVREIHSRGYVLGPGNAIWGQQYIWPVKADYRISYVSPDYSQTVITRLERDYVWIMARTPGISEADYRRLVEIARRQGYDASLIRRVPQAGS